MEVEVVVEELIVVLGWKVGKNSEWHCCKYLYFSLSSSSSFDLCTTKLLLSQFLSLYHFFSGESFHGLPPKIETLVPVPVPVAATAEEVVLEEALTFCFL